MEPNPAPPSKSTSKSRNGKPGSAAGQPSNGGANQSAKESRSSKPEKSSARFQIYVGGINEIYKESSIKELFSKYGDVSFVNLNAAKRFAFVGFNADDSTRDKILSSDIRFPDNNKLTIQLRKGPESKETTHSKKPLSAKASFTSPSESSSSSTTGPRVVYSAEPLPASTKPSFGSFFQIAANADRILRCPVCQNYYNNSYILQCTHSICGQCFDSSQKNANIICTICKIASPKSASIKNTTLDDICHALCGNQMERTPLSAHSPKDSPQPDISVVPEPVKPSKEPSSSSIVAVVETSSSSVSLPVAASSSSESVVPKPEQQPQDAVAPKQDAAPAPSSAPSKKSKKSKAEQKSNSASLMPKPFCSNCNRYFANDQAFEQHILSAHMNKKPSQAPYSPLAAPESDHEDDDDLSDLPPLVSMSLPSSSSVGVDQAPAGSLASASFSAIIQRLKYEHLEGIEFGNCSTERLSRAVSELVSSLNAAEIQRIIQVCSGEEEDPTASRLYDSGFKIEKNTSTKSLEAKLPLNFLKFGLSENPIIRVPESAGALALQRRIADWSLFAAIVSDEDLDSCKGRTRLKAVLQANPTEEQPRFAMHRQGDSSRCLASWNFKGKVVKVDLHWYDEDARSGNEQVAENASRSLVCLARSVVDLH